MAMSVGNSDSDSTTTTNSSSTTSTRHNNSSNNKSNNSKPKTMGKRPGKRPGRKPAKIDERAKLERSRQSAKECRARKKLRYQYLEELVLNREKAVFSLRDELEMFKQWCIQLDRGHIPEKLIKMIANEEMAKQRKQAEEMKRAAEVQNQLCQDHQQAASTSAAREYSSSSSSPSSASSSSPPQVSDVTYHSQFQPQLQRQQTQPRLPPPYPHAQSSSAPSRFPLTRQTAFDEGSDSSVISATKSSIHHLQSQRQQQYKTSYHPSSGTSQMLVLPANPKTSSVGNFYPQNTYQQQEQQLPKHQNVSTTGNISVLPNPAQQMGTQQGFQTRQPLPQQQQNLGFHPAQTTSAGYPSMSRVKSEPSPMLLSSQPSLDDISDLINQETTQNQKREQFSSSIYHQSGILSSSSTTSGARVRSLSNPVSLMSLNRPQYSTSLTGQMQANPISHSFTSSTDNTMSLVSGTPLSLPSGNERAGTELGLFSGISLGCGSLPSVTVEESDSSDENNYSSQLFQSSMTGQKRTVSDPNIHALNKKAKSLDSEMGQNTLTESLLGFFSEAEQSSAPYCPISKLDNLTTVKCMGSSSSLNTPSVSPFGVVPRNTDSPMTTSSDVMSPAPSTHSGHMSVTPSSSTNPSPAPTSTCYEIPTTSSQLSSTSMECDIETSLASTPTIESFLFSTISQEISSPVVCNETGLSATISEPIPEWYSFLDDLQVDSSSMPQQMSSSHHKDNTQITSFQPKQYQQSYPSQNQNFTYLPTYAKDNVSHLNVPSILEELSGSEDSV